MVKLGATLRDASGLLRDFLSAEEYASQKGYLQSVNLMLKLTGIFLLVSLAIPAGIPFSLLLLFFSGAMAHFSKIPLQDYVRRIGVIPSFSLIIALPWIFISPGEPVFEFFVLSATRKGIFRMAEFSLRVAGCVSTVSLLLFTTKTPHLFRTLRSFRVLEPLLTVLEVTYRYIFTFLSMIRGILLGRECRVVSDRGVREKWEEGGKIAGTFLSRTIAKGERVHKAMMAKGYGNSRRISPKTPKITSQNFIFLGLLGMMVIMWALIG